MSKKIEPVLKATKNSKDFIKALDEIRDYLKKNNKSPEEFFNFREER